MYVCYQKETEEQKICFATSSVLNNDGSYVPTLAASLSARCGGGTQRSPTGLIVRVCGRPAWHSRLGILCGFWHTHLNASNLCSNALGFDELRGAESFPSFRSRQPHALPRPPCSTRRSRRRSGRGHGAARPSSPLPKAEADGRRGLVEGRGGDEPDAPTWPAQPQRSLNAPRQLEVRHARPPAAAPPRALLSMCPREPPPGPLLFAFCWNHSCSARELL